jgi:hypothetical protein
MSAYATPESLVRIVEAALDLPTEGQVPTRLTSTITQMFGWSSIASLDFFNRICSHGDCHYLEYGVWCARSLCGAAEGNTGRFVGVDDYDSDSSQYFLDGCAVRTLKPLGEIAKMNVAGRPNVSLVDSNFRDYTPQPPVNVFYYDADHSREATRDGILQVAPLLRPGILMVDDFTWVPVHDGTIDGLKQSGLALHKSWFLSPLDGHNQEGLFVAVVSHR